MNSPHHHHHEHHDVHQQRLLWFFSFCNQRSSSSSSSGRGSRRKSASNRNKFAIQYQQQLQQQQRQSSNVFGCGLTEHTQLFSEDDSIPHIVKSCTRFIEKQGIIFGIYRLSGMRVNIQKLRQDFDKNPKISMIDSEAISNDAHAVACVLKQYFRELPTPLLTFHMYEKFIELFKYSSNNSTNNNNNNDFNTNNNANSANNQEQINFDNDNDNTNCGSTTFHHATTTMVTNPKTMTSKSKSSSSTQQSNDAIATQTQKQTQFTTSASDSQLLSLSSVVTTTTSDIKYQVRLDDLKRLLFQLPRAHYQTLKFLMRHLACIAANGKKTGMDSKNVAIVWAPNLLKPRELELSAGLETLQIIGLQAVITEQLIKHHKFLFETDDDGDPDIETIGESRDETKVLKIDEDKAEVIHRNYNMPPDSPQQQQQFKPPHQQPKQVPESIHKDDEPKDVEKHDDDDDDANSNMEGEAEGTCEPRE